MQRMCAIPWPIHRNAPALAITLLFAGVAVAQVPPFLDTFDGAPMDPLDPEWTPINLVSHPGFNGSGQYVVDGVLSADSGLRRGMGGQGSFIAEVSLELGPFFLSGSGGTKSDFKFRFGGSGGNVEVVLNSYRGIRVHASQLGGDIAQTTLNSLADGDRFDLQLSFLDLNGSFEVKYAINGGPWQDLASASGITGYLDGNCDVIFYKFNNSPPTLPRMQLDRYEVRENPAADLVPEAHPDVYQTPQDTLLVVPAPGVLTNDTHPLDWPLAAELVTDARLGSLNLSTNGSFTYQPLAGYTGLDSFSYRATNGTFFSAPAEVTIDVLPPPLKIVDFRLVGTGPDERRLEWNSEAEKTYGIWGAADLDGTWSPVVTNLPATPPTNTYELAGPPQPFEAYRVTEEGPLPWPNTDYCAMMAQEVQGKKCGFLAGNLVYYIGGTHGWNNQGDETIGLTHPFFHDLRSRGHGMVTNAATGIGHDLQGWEFWKATRIAYGTVIIGSTEYTNPVPDRMYWRPDRMICEYAVGGVPIYEEKFISTNDVVCSIIKSPVPIQIRFEGQSFVRDGKSIQKTSTQQFDSTHNIVHVTEGGTILVKPEEGGPEYEGQLMYDGMSTVVSASEDLSGTYSGYLDGTGRQQYEFTVPCDADGVSVVWAMDDLYANARDRVLDVLSDPEGHLAAKKAHMNDLLNNQVPYFRCSDQDIVDIYYYLWALHMMYYIDVGVGWEAYPHTQTAVNNFLGMHRYDAAFQIRVGAWTKDKDYYAYGNVLIWSALLPYAETLGRLPDNMGTTWHSGIYGATTDHPNGAWEIFERTGDTNFLADCYTPYFKPLFWDGIIEHWGYRYNAADSLAKMAVVLGHPADTSHWYNVVNMGNISSWLNARWESSTNDWFLGAFPMTWGGMGYMGMEEFPDDWARDMTDTWAMDDVNGFFTEVAPSTWALKDWAGVSDVFTITPDTCWWALRGMYLHHVGTNVNRLAMNHLKGYNMEWGLPVAPEALDIHFDPWGDQYSNFNAGKILLILEGMTGVDYSIPDGTFTVADHMPEDWTFMELKLPVTRPVQTDWVTVRVDRSEAGGGVIDKAVTVTGNPLPTLEIQPWLEEKPLVSATGGYTNAPTHHIGYTFASTTNTTVAIQLQD